MCLSALIGFVNNALRHIIYATSLPPGGTPDAHIQARRARWIRPRDPLEGVPRGQFFWVFNKQPLSALTPA